MNSYHRNRDGTEMKFEFSSLLRKTYNLILMPILLILLILIVDSSNNSNNNNNNNNALTVQGFSIKSEFKTIRHITETKSSHNRRSILHLPIALVVASNAAAIQPASAKSTGQQNNPMEDINTIIDAADTLDKLLSNWDKATIDCTYADVPRELLEQKNKEQLLEKASTFALFDKSTSVVSCKKTNKIVRDYIGVTGKGPLVNIEKKMLKRYVVEKIDPDVLDEYYTQVENFQNAISRASSLSYAAGIADFDSVNNFEKDSKVSEENSNLEQARKAIGEAKTSIDQIVQYLTLES